MRYRNKINTHLREACTRNDPLLKRRCKALGLIVLVFATLSLNAGIEAFASSNMRLSALEALFFEDVLGKSKVSAFDVQETFGGELILPDGSYDIHHDKDAGVLGYSTALSPDDAYRQLSAVLVAHEWAEVDGGLAGSGSFVKATDQYRWLFVTCIGIADSTSVVIRYQ